MIIHNGDHLEYEIENANTPLKERSDWPLPSFDAKDWAEAFCKRFPQMDEGVMLAWFANALMRGFDEHFFSHVNTDHRGNMGVFERIKERLQHAEAFEEDDGHLLEDAATEIARLRTALEEITKCDDDGYGPAGYCANIAQKALANIVPEQLTEKKDAT
jgi:hypothetical protein